MKQTILSKMILGALLAGSLGMTACAKKDGSSVRVAGRGGVVSSGNGGAPTPGNTATCSNGQAGTGTLQADSVEAVKGLVSATISPQSFGNICRVNFSASLKFDSAGAIVGSGSTILLQIVDDWVGQKTNDGKVIQAYEIQFSNANSGVLNRSTGTVQAVFSDSYGSFLISGQVSGSTVNGKVYFNNKVAVDGYSPMPGNNTDWVPLGSFSSPTATMIK